MSKREKYSCKSSKITNRVVKFMQVYDVFVTIFVVAASLIIKFVFLGTEWFPRAGDTLFSLWIFSRCTQIRSTLVQVNKQSVATARRHSKEGLVKFPCDPTWLISSQLSPGKIPPFLFQLIKPDWGFNFSQEPMSRSMQLHHISVTAFL